MNGAAARKAAAAWARARADGFDEYKRLVFDLGPAAPAALPDSARALSAAAARDPRAWRAKYGRVLAALGRLEAARAALAVAKDDPDAPRWLGALLLADGDAAGAESVLTRAAPDDAWARALLGAARLSLGRPAAPDLDAARRAGGEPGRFAELVEALAAAGAGDPAPARAVLEREIARAPGSAWALIVRSRLSAQSGDVAARLRDLDAALKRDPGARVRDERGRAFEEVGDMHRALAEADAAVAASPDAERYLRRAHIQVCRRYYHMAGPDFAVATRLDPSRVEAWLGAASVALTRGDAGAAAALAARGARARPDDAWARLEALRYAVYAGKGRAVERGLAAVEKSRPDLAFDARLIGGLSSLKRRAYAQAARRFAAAAKAAPGPGAAKKAAFYRVIALGLLTRSETRRARRGERRLLICGLGGSVPYTATLGALRAAAACDFAYNNLSEPEVAALISSLVAECEPTMFDARGADRRWTRTIFRNVHPGRTVGFITRGHPQVCGGLAGSLMAECERTGATWSLLPAVSSMDTLALRAAPGAELWGQQVMDWSSAFDANFRLDSRLPAVVYFSAAAHGVTADEFARFCGALEKVYGADFRVLFYGRSFALPPESVPLSDVRGWYGKIDPSFTLVLPPKVRA